MKGEPRMNPKKILLKTIVFTLLISASCFGGTMAEKQSNFNSIQDVPDSVWQKLSEKKIYFGHQSVGFNIIDGIKAIMKAHPEIKLNIVETTDGSDFATGIFGHSRVGKNVDPVSKIREFADYVDQGIGKKADAAALKFCYVDINQETDVNRMLDDYRQTIIALNKKYPDMRIIHFTSPLTMNKTTWKTWIKKKLGKKDAWEYGVNIRRAEYNQKLIETYQGKEPIFDIAKIESTYPNGKRCTFEIKGNTYYSMVPEYTSDGGHLNELGRRKVAEQFLIFLANLI